MHQSNRFAVSGLRRLLYLASLLVAVTLTSGCAAFYVDTALKDMQPQQVQKVTSPKPVQLLFEFQTKGAANSAATNYLKKQVTELTTKSGLFSTVSETPVDGGAVLHLTINNVPMTDDAFAKGFVAGLTFGAAGSVVTDGYICNVSYLSGNGTPKVTKTLRHAIHTTVGAKNAPPNAKHMPSMTEAVETMVRQIVLNGLNDLAVDPALSK